MALRSSLEGKCWPAADAGKSRAKATRTGSLRQSTEMRLMAEIMEVPPTRLRSTRSSVHKRPRTAHARAGEHDWEVPRAARRPSVFEVSGRLLVRLRLEARTLGLGLANCGLERLVGEQRQVGRCALEVAVLHRARDDLGL